MQDQDQAHFEPAGGVFAVYRTYSAVDRIDEGLGGWLFGGCGGRMELRDMQDDLVAKLNHNHGAGGIV